MKGGSYLYVRKTVMLNPSWTLFIKTYNCIVIYVIRNMSKVHVMLEAGATDYNVFSIENVNKKSKNWKKKFYIVSTHDNPSTLLSMIRSMAKSKTAGGASKEVGMDMQSSGKDYKEKFHVKKVAGSITKEKAEDIKSRGIDRTGHSKVYNQLNPIN